jgi:hypothetical protein
MKYIKQYFIAEAQRYHKEHNRSPKMLDWKGKDDYPKYWEVRDEFGLWSKFLKAADLSLNIPVKAKGITCEICGREFTTGRTDRKICDSKKCRYIRDSIYHVKNLKERYECSAFHFIPEDKLIDYFSCLYEIKKKNINLMRLV